MGGYDSKSDEVAASAGAGTKGGKAPGKRTLTQGLPSRNDATRSGHPSVPGGEHDGKSEDPFDLHNTAVANPVVVAPMALGFPMTPVGAMKSQTVQFMNLTNEEHEIASVEEHGATEPGEFWFVGRLPELAPFGHHSGTIGFSPKGIGDRVTTLYFRDEKGTPVCSVRINGTAAPAMFGGKEPSTTMSEAAAPPTERDEQKGEDASPFEEIAELAAKQEPPPPIDPVLVNEQSEKLVQAGYLLMEGKGEEAEVLVKGVYAWLMENASDGDIQDKVGEHGMGTQQAMQLIYGAKEAVHTMITECWQVRRGETFSDKYWNTLLARWGMAREPLAIITGYLAADRSNLVMSAEQGGKVAMQVGAIGMTLPFFLRNPSVQIGALTRTLAWFGGTRVGAPIVSGATVVLETLPGRVAFGTATRTAATFAAGTNLATQVNEHGTELEDYNWPSVGLDYIVGAVSNKVVRAIVARYPGRMFSTAEWSKVGTLNMLGRIGKQQGAILLYGTTVSVARSQVSNTGAGKQVASDQVESALQMVKSAAIESWLYSPEGKAMFPQGRDDTRMTALGAALGAVIKFGVREAFDVVPHSDRLVEPHSDRLGTSEAEHE